MKRTTPSRPCPLPRCLTVLRVPLFPPCGHSLILTQDSFSADFSTDSRIAWHLRPS